MEHSLRQYSLLALMVVTVLLAGCGGGPGDATPTSTTPTVETYQGDASEYLLGADGFGDGWEVMATSEADVSAEGIQSGQAAELSGEEGNATVTLLVFGSPSDAQSHMQTQRDTYNGDGLQLANVDEGDAAFRTQTFDDEAIFAVRFSNVYVHVQGDVEGSTARRLATDQLDAVVGS